MAFLRGKGMENKQTNQLTNLNPSLLTRTLLNNLKDEIAESEKKIGRDTASTQVF